jgi:hypothetical protein
VDVIVVLELRIFVGIPAVETVVGAEADVFIETLVMLTDGTLEAGILTIGRLIVVGMVTFEVPIVVGMPTVTTEV